MNFFLFTRYRFHFILDPGSVTRERFAVHCNGITVFLFRPLYIIRSIPDEWEARVELIMRFRIEMIPDSTVYTISNRFHATFRAAFLFENAKTV